MDLKELYKKYHVTQFGLERFYASSLKDRFWDEDFVTPYYLFVEDIIIKDRSWVNIIKQLAQYLQTKYPKPLSELFEYRTDWSKGAIFSDHAFITNVKEIAPGLFVSVNFTSLHSVWIIQDLLNLYNVDLDDCLLIVHKPPRAEPSEIQKALEKDTIKNFKDYLKEQGCDDDKADKIIRCIKVYSTYLDKLNYSYNNFFLIDNAVTLSNYKAKFFQELYKVARLTEGQIKTAHKCLDYYTNYFSERKKGWTYMKKVTKMELEFLKPNGKKVVVDVTHQI